MTTRIISNILRTSRVAFDIPPPCAAIALAMRPTPPARPSRFTTSRRIAPLLTNGLWTMAQHASYLDRDSSAMALCALVASRVIRFGAERIGRHMEGKRFENN
jgi:hypothetical protein